MPKIEMGKQYRTRDGREVRIYAVDENEANSVHGAIKRPSDNRWVIFQWESDGRSCMANTCDIIEVKQPITRTYWLVHCRGENLLGYTFPTEDRAKTYAWQRRDHAIAITGPLEVTFTEGDGL